MDLHHWVKIDKLLCRFGPKTNLVLLPTHASFWRNSSTIFSLHAQVIIQHNRDTDFEKKNVLNVICMHHKQISKHHCISTAAWISEI